jgi:hypothetical protein
MPGSVIAMGRFNRPSIMVYGGSIHSEMEGESLNIVSAFEALGKNSITRLLLRISKGIQMLVRSRELVEECIQQIPCLIEARNEFTL